MKATEILNGNTRLLVVAVSLAVILFPLGYSVVSAPFSHGAEQPEPASGDYCLGSIDPAYMRFHHMELLQQARDEIVREGKTGDIMCEGRSVEVKLENCWQCHPSRERFCNRCHVAVNLYPNCFRCHYDPDEVPKRSPLASRAARGTQTEPGGEGHQP
jgi:hypothetical protein